MRKYLLLEVIIPLAFIAIVYWPGGAFQLGGESHLFLKVFATGDLLPICLLILINAYVRFERANEKLMRQIVALPTQPERESALDRVSGNSWYRIVIAALGAGLFLLYYDIRVTVIPYAFPDDSLPVRPEIIQYTKFGFAALLVVAVLGPIFHWLATDDDSK